MFLNHKARSAKLMWLNYTMGLKFYKIPRLLFWKLFKFIVYSDIDVYFKIINLVEYNNWTILLITHVIFHIFPFKTIRALHGN